MSEMDVDNGKYYKAAFAVGWIANFALWILVVWVLIRCILAPVSQSHFVMVALAAFALLFVCLSIAFPLFLRTKNYYSMLACICFIVAQFLIVLVLSLSIFSDDRIIDRVRFADDPLTWVQSRRWLPIAFAVVFLPLFLAEIFFINRFSHIAEPPAPSDDDEAGHSYVPVASTE
ncbi:hypothetical protein M3Y99_00797900 [Aphelenchoides fujianensis]|nr:hypothetical protein M3Y99_00797900 [Aphelenchoides fujianensis]